LLKINSLSHEMKMKLGESGVKSKEDLADLASDELREIVGATALSEKQANEIIMAARADWFKDSPANPA